MLKVAVALDDTPESRVALEKACTCWNQDVFLQLITVVQPVMSATTSVIGSAMTATDRDAWVALTSRQEGAALQIVNEAETIASGLLKVPQERIIKRMLRPQPLPMGDTGIGRALLDYVQAEHPDVLVIGSRIMGGIKRTFLGLVGAGSTTDHVLHHLEVPTLVAHLPSAEAASSAGMQDVYVMEARGTGSDAITHLPSAEGEGPSRGRHVVVALDDSPSAQAALEWVLQHVLQPRDTLHIISIAGRSHIQDLAGTAALGYIPSELWQSDEREWAFTGGLVAQAVAFARAHGAAGNTIDHRALLPQGGASDVGEAVLQYTRLAQADLVVLGSRGMGAVRGALMSLVGLGSVSEYVVHRATCAVLIVRGRSDKASPAATAAAASSAPGAATTPAAVPAQPDTAHRAAAADTPAVAAAAPALPAGVQHAAPTAAAAAAPVQLAGTQPATAAAAGVPPPDTSAMGGPPPTSSAPQDIPAAVGAAPSAGSEFRPASV